MRNSKADIEKELGIEIGGTYLVNFYSNSYSNEIREVFVYNITKKGFVKLYPNSWYWRDEFEVLDRID